MQCTIRKMQKQDYDKVCDMMHALLRLHAVKSKYISKKYLEKFDAHREIKGRNKEILVALVDGDVAGYAYLSIEKSEVFFKFKKYLYLIDIYVDEKYQGGGVGRKLMKEAKKMAKRKGLHMFTRIFPFSKQMLGLTSKEDGELLHSTFIFPK